MQIIKDKQIIDDNWNYVADDAQLVPGNVSVSFARWQKDKADLLAHNGKVGVRLGAVDCVEDIAADLSTIDLIELAVVDFADGRLFSQAWYLRNRFAFLGEIRATGHFMPDQVFYLTRVGVNAFAPENNDYLPFVLSNLNDFTVKYQKSVN